MITHKFNLILGGWIGHFRKRINQYDMWVANQDPVVIWLSGLHIPEAYITALVQVSHIFIIIYYFIILLLKIKSKKTIIY